MPPEREAEFATWVNTWRDAIRDTLKKSPEGQDILNTLEGIRQEDVSQKPGLLIRNMPEPNKPEKEANGYAPRRHGIFISLLLQLAGPDHKQMQSTAQYTVNGYHHLQIHRDHVDINTLYRLEDRDEDVPTLFFTADDILNFMVEHESEYRQQYIEDKMLNTEEIAELFPCPFR